MHDKKNNNRPLKRYKRLKESKQMSYPTDLIQFAAHKGLKTRDE